jgi:hypothetical protein
MMLAIYVAAGALLVFVAGICLGMVIMTTLARSLLTRELGTKFGKLLAKQAAEVDREFKEASVRIGAGRKRAMVAQPKRFTVERPKPPEAA